ncbi:MAG: hypothetical protein WCI91_01020 [Candidatus Nomurabacteria bacterium]
MKTTKRINGYLYSVDSDVKSESEIVDQEELTAEELLVSEGLSSEEIRRKIIEAE